MIAMFHVAAQSRASAPSALGFYGNITFIARELSGGGRVKTFSGLTAWTPMAVRRVIEHVANTKS